MGAIFGGGIGLLFNDSTSIFLLPLMILFGAIGGAFWASIPALLKTKFNTNEILTSLMLTYVALFILDYFVVGPWKDPAGYGLPKSMPFPDAGRLPLLFDGLRIHIGIYFAIIICFITHIVYNKTLFGFKLRVSGLSSKASQYAGFKYKNLIFYTFIISGACAGLAGLFEVSGPIGLLYRDISPNYGFTAIIVAFLGRLNPIGIILSSLLIALTYLGAEDAQLFLKIPSAVGFVFQGLVLFFLLGTDFLNRYRVSIS
jgi:simple sugar transport system permease protein